MNHFSIHFNMFVLFSLYLLADKKMIPIENYGVKCMSMGSLVAEEEALVWRGPMASVVCIFLLLSVYYSQCRLLGTCYLSGHEST